MKLELQFNKITTMSSTLRYWAAAGPENTRPQRQQPAHLFMSSRAANSWNFLNNRRFSSETTSIRPRLLKVLKRLFFPYSPQIRDLGPLSELTSLEDLRLESVMIDELFAARRVKKPGKRSTSSQAGAGLITPIFLRSSGYTPA
jgi:hypothetical protein